MKSKLLDWEKFVLLIYVIGFIFSVIALVLTLIGFVWFPDFYEQNNLAKELWKNFGYCYGSLIILLINFALILPLIIIKKFIKNVKDGITEVIAIILTWSVIDALGFAQFVKTFLDTSNNTLLIYSLATVKSGRALFTANDLESIFYLVFLIVFIFSFSFRIVKRVKLFRKGNRTENTPLLLKNFLTKKPLQKIAPRNSLENKSLMDLRILANVTVKKVKANWFKGFELETVRLEITGNAPYVESFVLIKQKPKIEPYV